MKRLDSSQVDLELLSIFGFDVLDRELGVLGSVVDISSLRAPGSNQLYVVSSIRPYRQPVDIQNLIDAACRSTKSHENGKSSLNIHHKGNLKRTERNHRIESISEKSSR